MNSIQNIFEARGLIVSRETIEKLEIYHRLLLKWQRAINLVGPATVDEAAERHFYDSAQVLRLIADPAVRLADMGAGAGFPGLVLAILGMTDVHLIEADVRKATFLREVSRETGTSVTIHDKRVEDCDIADIGIFSARALAPLRDLLGYMDSLTDAGAKPYGLFMKGAQFQEEIEAAAKRWNFEAEVFESATDPAARIIKIVNLAKK